MTKQERFFIAGGAGFIGSCFVDRLLSRQSEERVGGVTVFDNFSSGKEWFVKHHEDDRRFRLIRGEIKNINELAGAMKDHDVVIHLASNPDIARAAKEPDVDFWDGTFLTNNVIEAMRRAGVPRILYASGSGVYGELGQKVIVENHSPMEPVSTYGASKLAGEALICSYCHMFGLRGVAFRFANVVGGRQTHGVGLDFIKKLRRDPSKLTILGNGQQNKSYIHVSDIIEAVLMVHYQEEHAFAAYNVSTKDSLTVREIADLVIEALGLSRGAISMEFTGGDRGWKGDVPVVFLSSDKVRSLGWENRLTSRQAMLKAVTDMIPHVDAGLL